MRLTFRQGLVQYPADYLQKIINDVVISTANGPIVATLSNGVAEYYHTEPQNSGPYTAWTGLTTGVDYWLYVDINKVTGERTFGQTTLEPIDNVVAPVSPVVNQHWFDTNTMTMKVWSGSVWVEYIRVFVAQLSGSNTFTYYPVGTQVGVATSYLSGRILFDGVGVAIRQSNGKFLTTEDQFFVDGSSIQTAKLESTVISAIADESIPAYSVVKYNTFGRIGLARYEDISNTVIALVTDNVLFGDAVNIILQGVIINPSWNWATINAPLWVDVAGQLTDVDPNTINSLRPSAVPIARVVANDTIIFDQGMGGRGATGAPGSASANISPASTAVLGTVLLATAPVDSANPIAVGANDPRLTNARTPTAHTHAATEVSYIGHGNIATGTAQAAINSLEDNKLNLTGGVLTGPLTLSADPTSILQAATKQYVDSRVSGLMWINPILYVNLIADNLNTPPTSPGYTDVYVVATGGTGAWIGLDGHLVRWSGTAWTDLGLPVDAGRIGIAMESTSTPSGTFLNKKNQIAVWNQSTSSWTFYTPIGNNAVFVSNANSLHSFHQYVYDAVNAKWIEFSGPQAIQPGAHLQLSGNVLNVIDGSGSTLNADLLDGLHASSFSLATHNHDTVYVQLAGSVMSGPLTLNANPTAALHAATKQYVDSQDLSKVSKAGDTMTGPLVLANDPTAALQAATKQYVDAHAVAITPGTPQQVLSTDDVGDVVWNNRYELVTLVGLLA